MLNHSSAESRDQPAEIAGALSHCLSAPIPRHQIAPRTHVVTDVAEQLEAHKAVYVHGGHGTGKTTVLHMYARSNNHSTISVFLPANGVGMATPQFVRQEFVPQMRFLLGEKQQEDLTLLESESIYNHLAGRLARRSKQSIGPVTFLIDGFGDQSPEFQDTLLKSVLPLSYAQADFRLLLSGTPNTLPSLNAIRLQYALLQLGGLSDAECEPLLVDHVKHSEERHALLRAIGNGHPGRLRQSILGLRRGEDIESVIEQAKESYEELVRLEIDHALSLGEDSGAILAVLAYSRRPYTSAEIAQVSDLPVSVVETRLGQLSLASLGRDGWRLATPFHQEVARLRQQGIRLNVTDRLIQLSLKERSNPMEYVLAAGYLQDAERHDDIVDLLSAKNLTDILEHVEDFHTAEELCGLGVGSAIDRGHTAQGFRLALSAGVASSLREPTSLATIVSALCTLDQAAQALELITAIPMLPDRLALFARVGRHESEVGNRLPQGVLDQVDTLIERVGPQLSPEAALAIGADLFSFYAAAAIRLARHAASNNGNQEAPHDFLRVIALRSGPKRNPTGIEQPQKDQAFRDLLDENSRALLNALDNATHQGSLYAVLESTGLLEDDEALPLLESLAPTIVRRSASDARKLLRHIATSMLGGSHLRMPRMRALGSILEALLIVQNSVRVDDLAAELQAIATSDNSAPSADVLHLQIHIELLKDQPSELQLTNHVKRATELSDLSTRLEALASAFTAATARYAALPNPSLSSLIEDLRVRLIATTSQVLQETGDHEAVLTRPLQIIARANVELALELAEHANTKDRREALRELVVAEHLESPNSLGNSFPTCLAIIQNTQDAAARWRLLDACIATVRSFGNQAFDRNICKLLQWLVDQICIVEPKRSRLELLVSLASAVQSEYSSYEFNQGSLLQQIVELSKHETRPWILLDSIAELGRKRIAQGDAKAIVVDTVLSVINHAQITSEHATRTYGLYLSIALTAASNASSKGVLTQDDLSRLEALLQRLDDLPDRLSLLERFCMQLWALRQTKQFEDAVDAMIVPLLDEAKRSSHDLYVSLVAIASPALYARSTELLASYTQDARFSESDKEAIWHRVLEAVVRRQSLEEPFYIGGEMARELTYTDVLQLLSTAQHVSDESAVYRCIRAISSSVNRYPTALSREQLDYVSTRCDDLILKKLPQSTGIQHEGYLLLAQAQVCRIREQTLKGAALDAIAKRARGIPNVSDRAYVLAELALLTGPEKQRRRLLSEAEALVEDITTDLERVDRLCTIADSYRTFDTEAAKKAVERTWGHLVLSNQEEGMDARQMRRRIVDVAYSISPAFARNLANKLDADVARKARREIASRTSVLEARDSALGSKANAQNFTPSVLTSGLWEVLKKLRSGDMKAPPRPDAILRDAYSVMQKSIDRSYPAVALYVESVSRSFGKPEILADLARVTLDATLDNLDFFTASLSRVRGRANELQSTSRSSDLDSITIAPKDRDAATSFIRSWLERHASEQIVLVDRYFGTDELGFVLDCMMACPLVPISIVCGFEGRGMNTVSIAENMAQHWRRISDQPPPKCTFYVTSLVADEGSGSQPRMPFHDRYLFGDTHALSLNSSLNGLGREHVTTISSTNNSERERMWNEAVSPLLNGARRIFGKSISTMVFDLGNE